MIIKNQEKKESQEGPQKSKFSILRNFLSVFTLDNFITSWHPFTKMQDDSKKTFNIKVLDLDEFYNFVLEDWCPKNA